MYLERISAFKQEIFVASHNIYRRIKNISLIDCLNKLYCVKGFEEGIVPVLIPLLRICKLYSIHRFDAWIDVLSTQRHLYRGTLFITNIHTLLEEYSAENFFMALGSICETAEILKKYEMFTFDNFTRFSSQFGNQSLFGYLAQNPKRLFFLTGYLACIVSRLHSYIKYPATGGIAPEELRALAPMQIRRKIKEKKRNDLLDVAVGIGEIAIIMFKFYLHKNKNPSNNLMTAFYLVELGARQMSLIRFLIR